MKRAAIIVCVILLLAADAETAETPDAALEARRAQKQAQAQAQEERLTQAEDTALIDGVSEEEKNKTASAPSEPEASFFVTKIIVEGVTRLTPEEIRRVTEPWENQTLTLAKAQAIAQSITAKYYLKGYITSRAYLPPQKLDLGELRISAQEGKLGEASVQGNRFFSAKRLTRQVADQIGRVLNYDDIYQKISQMNLHPDREVKAVIKPGQQVGTSDLLLDVKDRFPLHVGAEVNNFGTRLTGKERYNLTLRHTNLFGNDDIFAARVQVNEHVLAGGGQYLFEVGDYGTQITLGSSWTQVSLGEELESLDIEGSSAYYSASIGQPVFKTRNLDLTMAGGLDSISVENQALGVTTSEDEVRTIHLRATLNERDAYGRSFILNNFAWGVPWLGASEKHDPGLSRADAGATFFKYELSLIRLHPIYDSTVLYLQGTAQMTNDRLLASQQYDMGGVYSVRGYPQSDFQGDEGAGFSAEIRIPFYFIPREYKLPKSDKPLWNRVHLVVFVDGAASHLNNPSPGEVESKTNFGAGAGIRIELDRNWSARFEWAKPFGDNPTNSSSASQFYFTISGDFL